MNFGSSEFEDDNSLFLYSFVLSVFEIMPLKSEVLVKDGYNHGKEEEILNRHLTSVLGSAVSLHFEFI